MNKQDLRKLLVFSLLIMIALFIYNLRLYFKSKETNLFMTSILKDYELMKDDFNKNIQDIENSREDIYEKYYEEKINKLLNIEKIIALAKEEWKYFLTVNGTEFKASSISTEEKEILIALKEIELESILPKGMHILGRLEGGDIDSHVKIDPNIPFEIKIKRNKNIRVAEYRIQNLDGDTSIPIQISETLRERLNLEKRDFNIIIN